MKMLIEKSEKQSSHMRTSKTGKVYSAGSGAKKIKKKINLPKNVKSVFKTAIEEFKNNTLRYFKNAKILSASDDIEGAMFALEEEGYSWDKAVKLVEKYLEPSFKKIVEKNGKEYEPWS